MHRFTPASPRRGAVALTLVTLAALAGCDPDGIPPGEAPPETPPPTASDPPDRETGPIGQISQPVVYGIDNRRNVDDHPDASLRLLARRSTVTLVRPGRIDARDPANVRLISGTLGDKHALCPGEAFSAEPAPGFCSGTLIGDDLVLTAGHCVDAATCADTRFVFGFRRDAAGASPPLSTADVYACRSVVARRYTAGTLGLDHAIVRLDRAATPRYVPAPVTRGPAPVVDGARLGMIGSPSGIPLKIDTGGRVRDARAAQRDYFVATTDSFGGNSGSGVYGLDDYRLVGVLVRGDDDYIDRGGCQVVKTCAEGDCRGEDITYASAAIEDLCRVEPQNALCTPRERMSFAATGTLSATRNTPARFVFVAPSQTLTYGTCGQHGASGVGNTWLRLFDADGVEVSSSNDAAGCGLLSAGRYQPPALTGGLYELRAGCATTGACSGVAAWKVDGTAGTFSYDAVATDGVRRATVDATLTARGGETITVGTCRTPGADADGDTWLRLFDPAGVEVAANDDGPGDCGRGSYLTHTLARAGTYTVRAGCYGATACGGTVRALVEPAGVFAYSASDTGDAFRNTRDFDVWLGAGDVLRASTCGQGSRTALRLTDAAGRLAATSAPVCPTNGAIDYTAAAAGTYRVHAGCAGTAACSSAVTWQVYRKTGTKVISYAGSDTDSARRNTARVSLWLAPGRTLTAGTCGLAGASGTGDTLLRLVGPTGEEIASNDDACGGRLSTLRQSASAGAFELRAGCYQNGACEGTVVVSD